MLEDYVAGVLQGILIYEANTSRSSLDLLIRYRDAFTTYDLGMQYGARLFHYLDRHWVNANHCETGVHTYILRRIFFETLKIFGMNII